MVLLDRMTLSRLYEPHTVLPRTMMWRKEVVEKGSLKEGPKMASSVALKSGCLLLWMQI